jgi:hypothetical protein
MDSAPTVNPDWPDCQSEALSPRFGTSEIAGSSCEARIVTRQVDPSPRQRALTYSSKSSEFLAKKSIVVLEHPAYLPDVALCDFFLLPSTKNHIKSSHFGTWKRFRRL